MAMSLTAASGVSAAFTDTANAEDNIFQAGTVNMQLSATGTGGWSDIITAPFSTPANFAPGETYQDEVFVRNIGTVDFDSVIFSASSLTQTEAGMADLIYITEFRYDRNGDGNYTSGTNEDFTAAMVAAYDVDSDGLSLQDLIDNAGSSATGFELELGGANVLPGSITAPSDYLNGKGVRITVEFDSTAGNIFQGDNVTLDFDFTGSNIE